MAHGRLDGLWSTTWFMVD